ncbi:hypothetical protein BU25DRAFT_478646 [Macroventuria anomochaeta]|uniref:Uncharacterized protein n=1 Tax=Macroventuria anomochaeta TaxID=301207 RepID=A0ACB6RMC2_9PLEO|nr:uncharacterized protein BU25DRAFT_478646 [Macroventuria anomochaeta]KAF2623085.1 hypothetical protein BU25DRAFT_478646 [Macroventuria anomochaeta]
MVMGSCHVDTLTSMSNLALVLQHRGKYKQAMRLNQQSLDGFREILGKRHPSALTSMSNLAVVLQCQGRYEKSEKLQWQSVTVWGAPACRTSPVMRVTATSH